MAIPFKNNIDLGSNQLLNALLQKEPEHPQENLVAGRVYYNTLNQRAYYYDGTKWVGMDAKDAQMSSSDIIDEINDEQVKQINLARVNIGVFDKDSAGLVPKGVETTAGKYLRDDGSWVAPPNDNTTYEVFTKDKNGLVPKGSEGTTKYLREDGSWVVPPDTDTTYTNFSSSKSGLVPKGTAGSTKFLREDGGWEVPAYPTKNSLGLDNVTNHAQVQALTTGTTAGYVPTWGDTTGSTLAAGYQVSTSLSGELGSTDTLVTAQAAKNYADSVIGLSDAMVYKGPIAAGNNYPAADAGHTYKVTSKGIIGGTGGPEVEIGDMLICTTDSTAAGTHASVGSHWNVIQANVDGAVIGPASAANNNFAAFDKTTGKLIKDSGFSSTSFAGSVHDHTGVHPKKYSVDLTANATQTVTHNLNTEDVVVMIREASGNKQQVFADVKITGLNTISITMSTAPTASQYRVTVIG